MEINKEIMSALGITEIQVIADGNTHACMLLETDGNKWKIAADTDSLPQTATLKIKKTGGDDEAIKALFQSTEDEDFAFIYQVTVETESDTTEAINVMERQAAEWNKRKETRYEIGIDPARLDMLALSAPEQKIINRQYTLPCIISNLSFSGARLLTPESEYNKNDTIFLALAFKNPIEQIPVQCLVRNCALKKIENRIVDILSVEFIDPPLSYKRRLQHYIEEASLA